MAIKGGLLDCEGQMEIEENLNRLQERYGSYELGEKFVCEDFVETLTVKSSDVGNDYIEGTDNMNMSNLHSDAPEPSKLTIVINEVDCAVSEPVMDGAYENYAIAPNSSHIVGYKQITTMDSYPSIIFDSEITEDMVGKQYVFAAYERPVINIHPMDPLLHHKGEYVGELTSTDTEKIRTIVSNLIRSLEDAGYLKRKYEQ